MRKPCGNMIWATASAIISAFKKNELGLCSVRRCRVDPTVSDHNTGFSRHAQRLSCMPKRGRIRFALSQGIPPHHNFEKSKEAHLIKQCSAQLFWLVRNDRHGIALLGQCFERITHAGVDRINIRFD